METAADEVYPNRLRRFVSFALVVCDIFGKIVNDLRRHKARGRCKVEGRQLSTLPAKYTPRTPENRLWMDSGYAG